MPTVHFIAHDGQRSTVEVPTGLSLMRAALDNDVRGIDGDCGGQAACATCHVFIEAPWNALTGQRTPHEEEMLNFAAELRDTSRLACQVEMTNALDGIVVGLPEGQH